MMRVIHAPENIAGQPATISRAQRKIGIKSDVLVFDKSRFDYECDYNLRMNRWPKKFHILIRIVAFIICLTRYDLIHLHYRTFLLPGNADIRVAKLFGRKVVIEYWGSDILQTDIARKYTLVDENALNAVYAGIDNEKKRREISTVSRLVDRTIVGDYSLQVYSPDSVVVRQAIDLSHFPYVGVRPHSGIVSVVHAPTQRDLKGTTHIIRVIEELKSEGYPISFRLIENLPHQEAVSLYRSADIVIDDILQGPYGILAIECMALGKPVLDYIDAAFIDQYPGLPVVNTRPETLYKNLRYLLDTPAAREEIGRRGRKYVEENHNSEIIAEKLVALYQSL